MTDVQAGSKRPVEEGAEPAAKKQRTCTHISNSIKYTLEYYIFIF